MLRRPDVLILFYQHQPCYLKTCDREEISYAAKSVPQNTGNGEHYCGYCTLGCHSTRKNGPTVTWLANAAKSGAIFAEGFRADKVLFTKVNGKQLASGVEGT